VNNQPTDVVFETDGLTYRGLAWGDTSKPLVFTIHGWLDNALSFAVLAPLLTNYRVISIDLSGHGLSSHRSADANYHIWDDIPQLMAVIDQLGVSGAHIVGHSRGAAVAGMLAVALDERCLSLTMLDGMISRSFENDNGAELFRMSIAERKKYMARPPRIFESVEQFIDSRSRYGFTRENAQVLVPRALRRVDEGWLLLSDPKLFGNSTIKMSEETSDSLYRAMTFPVAAITGDTGFFTSEEAQQRIVGIANFAPNFYRLTVSGPHHFHMEGDVALLATRLTRFFETGELVTDLLERAS
tara:strand:+ start:1163 stop:2059 length:897 start_codon:yes stop_codon:yes gene_type:complete